MQSNQESKFNNIVIMALIPQGVLVFISVIWILFVPGDNIIKYFTFNLKNVFIGFLVGILIAIAGYIFYLVSKKITFLSDTVELFEKVLAPSFNKLSIPIIFILSIAAGVCEEVFFRGLLYKKLGILFSSIVFGLLHFPGLKYWIYAIWAGFSGALFCYLFSETGSLITPIIAHAVNNITGMFLLKSLKLN